MANLKTPLEVVKYIKIPDRRMISGLLHINVISHDDNDNIDDASEYYYANWAGQSSQIQKPTQPFNNQEPKDPNRTGLKHSMGDYDSLLFFVSGGMTLHEPVFSVGPLSQGYLATNGFINNASGPASWADGTGAFGGTGNENWYTTVTHPCQHFLKYHLISRINNGYGHTVMNDASKKYYKVQPITTHQFEYSLTGPKFLQTDIVGSLGNDITGDAGSLPDADEDNSDTREGNNFRHIVSNGIFSNDLDGDYVGGIGGVGDLSVPANNTFFPVVEGVEIYGKHSFNIPQHENVGGAGGSFVFSNSDTIQSNYSHQSNYWSMVIKIKLKGYDSVTGNGATQATHEFFKSRTNVMFQPFGETASFDIANSLHT